MKNLIFTRKLFLIVSMALLTASFSVWRPAKADVVLNPCISLPTNLFFGKSDTFSGGNVTALQTFLFNNGYLLHVPTGYFGPLTFNAVVKFQNAYAIPTTGFVGPITRGEIQALTCGSIPPPSSNVFINSISPSSGPTGTIVTLTGFGFMSDSNAINFDGVTFTHVSATPGIAIACTTDPNCHGGVQYSLSFSVPSNLSPYCPPGAYCPLFLRLVTPGVYPVSISNPIGTSNSVNFVVTGSNTQPISINGIDGPNSISMSVPGTWTVRVNAPLGTNLHYSVIWGDENIYAQGFAVPLPGNIQTSATFTHTYQRAGTFSPSFTVSDDFGHTQTVSTTVLVTPIY